MRLRLSEWPSPAVTRIQTSQMSGEKDLSQQMCFFKLSRGIQLTALENIICQHSPCCVRLSTTSIPSQIVDGEGIMSRIVWSCSYTASSCLPVASINCSPGISWATGDLVVFSSPQGSFISLVFFSRFLSWCKIYHLHHPVVGVPRSSTAYLCLRWRITSMYPSLIHHLLDSVLSFSAGRDRAENIPIHLHFMADNFINIYHIPTQ